MDQVTPLWRTMTRFSETRSIWRSRAVGRPMPRPRWSASGRRRAAGRRSRWPEIVAIEAANDLAARVNLFGVFDEDGLADDAVAGALVVDHVRDGGESSPVSTSTPALRRGTAFAKT